MTRLLRSAFCLSALVAVALPATAQAQSHRKIVVASKTVAPPLTVKQRSWLDVGNVVPVGTADAYPAQSTTLNQPIYATYIPAKFGQSTLPGQFDLPFQDNPRGPSYGGIFFDN